MTYGDLTVVELVDHRIARVRCVCGTELTRSLASLRRWRKLGRSCGCANRRPHGGSAAAGERHRAELAPRVAELRASGVSIRATARRLGVSVTTVYRVIREHGHA